MDAKENTPFIIEGTTLTGYHKKFFQKLGAVQLPEGITAIAENAFADCKTLTSVVISDTVKDIGDGAFSGCAALASVTLPNQVTNMGKGVFDGCLALREFRFSGTETCDCCGGPPHEKGQE